MGVAIQPGIDRRIRRASRFGAIALTLAAAAIVLVAGGGAEATTTPNDPYYPSQWAATRVRADQAWDTTASATARVAIVDTGISPLADLTGQLAPGYNAVEPGGGTLDDFGSYGLGTQVAGIVGAVGNNGRDMAGLNWRVTMLPVKVCTGTGYCPAAAMADGINWAVAQNVQVIHISAGFASSSPEIDAAVANAVGRGTIVIASAGNSATRVGFPGALPGVIAVGSTNSADTVSTFSGRGLELDLVAPGEGVVTLVSGGCCIERAGSALAAAHVTGAAAMLLARGVPAPTVQQVLLLGARDLGTAGRDDLYGNGLLDICRSLSLAGIACPVVAAPTATSTATATNTSVPPTATPTRTSTPVPPTATSTPLPPTATSTPVPPIATSTPLPPTATSTPLPPTATSTALPPTSTATQVAPTSTPTRTSTPVATPTCRIKGKRPRC